MAKCVVCKGELSDETHLVYRGDPMMMIIGPGSRNQMTPQRTIWCPKCGLSYSHLPGESDESEAD